MRQDGVYDRQELCQAGFVLAYRSNDPFDCSDATSSRQLALLQVITVVVLFAHQRLILVYKLLGQLLCERPDLVLKLLHYDLKRSNQFLRVDFVHELNVNLQQLAQVRLQKGLRPLVIEQFAQGQRRLKLQRQNVRSQALIYALNRGLYVFHVLQIHRVVELPVNPARATLKHRVC